MNPEIPAPRTDLDAVVARALTPAPAPGECYMISASWAERGGRTGQVVDLTIQPDSDHAIAFVVRRVSNIMGAKRAASLAKSGQLSVRLRALGADELEALAERVKAYRAEVEVGHD